MSSSTPNPKPTSPLPNPSQMHSSLSPNPIDLNPFHSPPPSLVSDPITRAVEAENLNRAFQDITDRNYTTRKATTREKGKAKEMMPETYALGGYSSSTGSEDCLDLGQTLQKCINRATGTFLAGSLGIGVHWVATQCGAKYEPLVVGLFVFLLASSTTFSRFIPTIKARFDYGAMIFILTFSLVSVAGYRVDKLIELAQNRFLTIAIGTSICIIISLVCFPVWAGSELHLLIHRNMDKLADSLNGCVEEYFDNTETDKPKEEDRNKKIQGYKCALNSKATEDMANLARWEPAHGHFNFRHPWKQYLKIGAQMRNCACCIETLTNCIDSELQAPEFLKTSFHDICMRLSSHCSKVLKDSAVTIKTMTKSSTIDFSVGEMNFAVEELQNTLKSLPHELLSEKMQTDQKTNAKQPVLNLIDILPLATTTSLLIEIAGKVEGIVNAIDELAGLAEFKPATDEKSKQDPSNMDKPDDETLKVFQKV